MTSLAEERYREILKESALRRYGEERSRAIEPAIREIARAVAAVSEHRVSFEDELSFYIEI